MREHDVHTRYKAWKKILSYFTVLLEEYEETCGGRDCVYWYNENAVTSMLAGAVWKAGGIALQDFACGRGSLGEEDKKGRADLWFKLDGQQFLVEAKIIYPSTPESIETLLEEPYDGAVQQVKEVEDDGIKIALFFVSPAINSYNKEKEFIETRLQEMKDALTEYDDWDIRYSYRTKTDYWWNLLESEEDSNYCWPGIFVLGRGQDSE